VRFVHSLHAGALSADVAGVLGARLGGLISLDLPVAPGFVIGTAAWHLWRVSGPPSNLPDSVTDEVRQAHAELGGSLLVVRASPALAGVASRPPVLDVGLTDDGFETLAKRTSSCYARRSFRELERPRVSRAEQLEAVLRSIIGDSGVPTAVIVQARTYAEGKPPSGHGRAFTRDPVRGTVWPTGEFRSGSSVMSLDALSSWLPAVGLQLRAALARVESLQRNVCEVCFTLEAGRLWIDDARPARHSRAAADRIAQSGLRPVPAAGLESSRSTAPPEPSAGRRSPSRRPAQ
jgi:hypothetical protein